MILLALANLLLKEFLLLILAHARNILLNGFLFLRTLIFSIFRHFTNEADMLRMFAQDGIEVSCGIAS